MADAAALAARAAGRGEQDPNRMEAREMGKQIDQMLLEAGAVVRVNDAARGNGLSWRNRTPPTM
ncbi:MAG: hypothetical protein WDO73_24820 [Ignavibacteriota bacterium]